MIRAPHREREKIFGVDKFKWRKAEVRASPYSRAESGRATFQTRPPPDIPGYTTKRGEESNLWRENGERSRGIFAMAMFLVPKKDPLGVN